MEMGVQTSILGVHQLFDENNFRVYLPSSSDWTAGVQVIIMFNRLKF